ncbi:hypothetical protein [Profundibacter sp.]
MAKLPTAAALGPRIVPQAPRGVAHVSGAGAVGQAAQQLGAATSSVGEVIHEREATALATERDTAVSDEIRDMLYNPETGFMSLKGQAAVNALPALQERLDGIKSTAMDGLNNTAKRKLEAQVDRRIASAKQSVKTRTLGQRDVWLEGATAARIESAYQDSLVDMTATNDSLAVIDSEVRARGIREGWSGEVLQLELGKAKSALMVGQVGQIATTDPIRAMEYLDKNKAGFLPSDYEALRAKLQPEVDRVIGAQIGAAAANGDLPYYNHNTSIEYSMGPNRPNAPNKPILDVVGKSVEDILGAGARIVITSGQEGSNPQYGSNRHKTGNAADVAIYRPDGTRVTASDPEMARIAQAAADNGAKGIGFGAEYMGGNLHVDLVKPGVGQDNAWGSGGNAMQADLVGRMDSRATFAADGLAAILNDKSLNERQRTAALQSYERYRTLNERQKSERKDANSKALFQMIEGGGSVDDLPLDVREELAGPVMAAARQYERSVAAGDVIQTDQQTYVDLTMQAVDDPAGFVATDPMLWRNKLDNVDFERFVNMQAQIKAGSAQPEDTSYKGPSPATLLSEADAQLRAAGIAKVDNPEEYAAFQSQYIRWARGNPESANDPLARNEQIGRLLMPVVTDAGFWSAEKKRRMFEIDFNGSTSTTEDDLTQADINDALSGGGLDVAGNRVTTEVATDVYTKLVAVLNGIDEADVDLADTGLIQPTARQLIEGLGAFYR